MNELDAMKSIDAALSALDDAAKVRALVWANQKFGNGAVAPITAQQSPHLPDQSTPPAKDKPAKVKAGKKIKNDYQSRQDHGPVS